MAKAQQQRRMRVPKDEHQERLERQRNQRVVEIALQHLEWAHERTQEAMEASHREEADCHSSTTMMWFDRLTGN